MEAQNVTIKIKAIEQCFPVVLFVMLYKMALTIESGDKILNYDHSNQINIQLTVLLCCTKPTNVLSLWMKSLSVAIQMKSNEQFFFCSAIYYALQCGS